MGFRIFMVEGWSKEREGLLHLIFSPNAATHPSSAATWRESRVGVYDRGCCMCCACSRSACAPACGAVAQAFRRHASKGLMQVQEQ